MVCTGGGLGCWWVLPAAGISVKIYNSLNTTPERTQSLSYNVLANFEPFEAVVEERTAVGVVIARGFGSVFSAARPVWSWGAWAARRSHICIC